MLENRLKEALETTERHMSRARECKDTPTEMIYAVVANKIREALFEIQQNLVIDEPETFTVSDLT